LTDSATETPPARTHEPTPSRIVIRKEKEAQPLPSGEREVPPSEKPESRTLFIDRFVRPFMLKHARELLEKTGEIEYFWMNNVRSQCYVTYKTVEQAKTTRDAVYNLIWPPANHSRLIAEFSTEEEALRRAELAQSREMPANQPQPSFRSPQPSIQPPPATISIKYDPRDLDRSRSDLDRSRSDRDRPDRDRLDRSRLDSQRSDRDRLVDSRDRLDPRDRDRRDTTRRDNRPQAPPPPPPKVTLETLFRKTQAKPCIYWLPLTDKEIEERKGSTTAQKA